VIAETARRPGDSGSLEGIFRRPRLSTYSGVRGSLRVLGLRGADCWRWERHSQRRGDGRRFGAAPTVTSGIISRVSAGIFSGLGQNPFWM
jgi:hypothetical protein